MSAPDLELVTRLKQTNPAFEATLNGHLAQALNQRRTDQQNFDRLVTAGRILDHAGNPVTRQQVDRLPVQRDAQGVMTFRPDFAQGLNDALVHLDRENQAKTIQGRTATWMTGLGAATGIAGIVQGEEGPKPLDWLKVKDGTGFLASFWNLLVGTLGYTAFTYADFVRVWRDWDGRWWTALSPHRLWRTLVTALVTAGLYYAVPLLDNLIRLSEDTAELLIRTFRLGAGSANWVRQRVRRTQRTLTA